ncbi:unannotated protein [freshwater metagenome]|uniref:Unannotated protein n=1 Tax=freshwater metagenome TaxID=449393 RepID=A0A6J7I0Q4_9ZZZZ
MTEKHHGAMRTTPIAIVVAIAVVVAMVGLWGWSKLGGVPDPQPAPNPTVSPTASPSPSPTADPKLPETLLWQVRTDDFIAVDNLLIGAPTNSSQTALIYIPGGLLVDAGAAGEMTLARTGVLSDTLASPHALSGLVGVRVSGAFVLERLAFSGLVDAVGGVWIRTSYGRTHLNGPAAASYVLTTNPGETEKEGIARFSDVMNSVFMRLPPDIEQMRQIVTSLGVSARGTIPSADIVALLMSTREAVRSGAYVESLLPTSVLRSGPQPIDVIQQTMSMSMMLRMLPTSVLRPGESDPPRVLLQTAVTNAVSTLNARDAIVSGGYLCVGGSRVADQIVTKVHIPDLSSAAREVGVALAQALGISEMQIVVGGMTNPTVDAEVVLGSDWKAP